MKIKILTLLISSLVLTGCEQEVAKLRHYDAADKYASQQAIVVVKVENASYVELTKFDPNKPKKVVTQSAKPASAPAAETKAATNADPTRQEAQTEYFDLRRLFTKQATFDQKAVPESGSEHAAQHGLSNNTPAAEVNTFRIFHTPKAFMPNSYAQSVYVIEPGTYYISMVHVEKDSLVAYSTVPGINKNNVVTYGAYTIKPGAVLFLGDIKCDWVNTALKHISISQRSVDLAKQELIADGKVKIAEQLRLAEIYQPGTKLNPITP